MHPTRELGPHTCSVSSGTLRRKAKALSQVGEVGQGQGVPLPPPSYKARMSKHAATTQIDQSAGGMACVLNRWSFCFNSQQLETFLKRTCPSWQAPFEEDDLILR